MIANLGDDVVVCVGSAFFVVIGTIVVRSRHGLAPHFKSSRLFESVEERAGFLRFWGYAAVCIGSFGLAVAAIGLLRQA